MKLIILFLALACCIRCGYTGLEKPSIAKLEEMSTEIQLLILEPLNLYELFEISEINNHFAGLAQHVFRHKYSHKIINISGHQRNQLKHLVEKIQINIHNMKKSQRKELHEVIDKYYSRSLNTIILESSLLEGNVLKYFQKPLENVHNLSIRGEIARSKAGLELNQIFPNTKIFEFNGDIRESTTYHGLAFGNLTSLSLKTFISLPTTPSILGNIIKMNPTVRHMNFVELRHFEYLKLASEHLNRLESLQIEWNRLDNDYDGEIMRFPMVTRLVLKNMHFDMSSIATFGPLEDLDIECFDGECIEFAVLYPSLKKLSIQQPILENALISRLDELPNLEELNIKCLSDIKSENLIRIVERNGKLNKLHFDILTFGVDLFHELQSHFNQGWFFSMGRNDFYMEKKSLNYT